jgi:nucleoid DNA-binding protein
MREKTFKMTKDEVIEELMDEWWNSLEIKVIENMIKDYLEEVGAELVEEK